MSLEFKYKNNIGEVVMSGSGKSAVRICEIEGLGPVINEYNSVIYPGYNGQETFATRATSRTITMALEINSKNAVEVARTTFKVLSRPGMLYVKNEIINRRISCSQVQIPDAKRMVKGQLLTFAVQFVCDNPYFEDSEDSIVPLYKRTKLLAIPFALPAAFGRITLGANIDVRGDIPTEPKISMFYPQTMADAESISIKNKTTGKEIVLNYSPKSEETVVIDIRKRRITGSLSGNLINYLSDNTFLGDFVLKPGKNILTVEMGDITSGFTLECKYNNLYGEAVLV